VYLQPNRGRLAYVSSFTAEPLKGSRVHGRDHNPYSMDQTGVPDEVVDAVHQGFGVFIDDFDARQIEWDSKC